MLPTASSRGHSSIAERWSASGRGKSELVMLKRLQLAFYYKHLLMVRALQGLSEAQIEARFHAADINGDDKLNFREFDKMLNSFNVNLAPGEREQLFQRFDSDNSGGPGSGGIHEVCTRRAGLSPQARHQESVQGIPRTQME
jgi:hypothetical protein